MPSGVGKGVVMPHGSKTDDLAGRGPTAGCGRNHNKHASAGINCVSGGN